MQLKKCVLISPSVKFAAFINYLKFAEIEEAPSPLEEKRGDLDWVLLLYIGDRGDSNTTAHMYNKSLQTLTSS
jgi:hypothetical protein